MKPHSQTPGRPILGKPISPTASPLREQIVPGVTLERDLVETVSRPMVMEQSSSSNSVTSMLARPSDVGWEPTTPRYPYTPIHMLYMIVNIPDEEVHQVQLPPNEGALRVYPRPGDIHVPPQWEPPWLMIISMSMREEPVTC